MKKIKYCALTTMSESLKSFVIPSLENLKEHGYVITISCAKDDAFHKEMKDQFSYFPLDIERGFNLPKTISNIFVLYRFFRREQFQMIEYGTENVAMCASLAGFLARVPVRIYNHWGARYIGLSGFSRFLSIWIERLAAVFSTDIRQVSHLNAEMCVKQHLYSAEKVKVLGKGGTIGVDLSRFDYKKRQQYRAEILEKFCLPENAFIFGFVGRIQRDKGINELIQAFKRISEKKEVYLFLVGNIDTHNPISHENIEWIKNNAHVVLTGYITDTYRYMSAFDVLVHPTYREGFGMVLQEAAAVKTPIITTNIMGPGEFVQNETTGLLVEPQNADQLYIAMDRLNAEPALCSRFAEESYRFVCENFERSVMLDGILKDRVDLAKKVK